MRRALFAVVLAAVLAATPRLSAQSQPPVDHGTSKLQYIVRASFFVSLLVIGGVLVWALLSKSDDTSRLRAAAGKVDKALADERGRSSAGWPGNNTRSDAGTQRAERASGLRLVPSLSLRPARD